MYFGKIIVPLFTVSFLFVTLSAVEKQKEKDAVIIGAKNHVSTFKHKHITHNT